MLARHSGHELFRKGGLHVSERTRFESFLIFYYYYYPEGTIPILPQQRDWVGGVREMAIFVDVQY